MSFVICLYCTFCLLQCWANGTNSIIERPVLWPLQLKNRVACELAVDQQSGYCGAYVGCSDHRQRKIAPDRSGCYIRRLN